LDDPKAKTDIAAQVMPLIEDILSPIERDTYRQQLARLLHVDERALLVAPGTRPPRGRKYPAYRRSPVQSPGREKVPSPVESIHSREAHILGVLLRRPDLIYHIDRQLQEYGLNRIGSEDMQHTDHQILLRLIQDSLRQDESEPLNFILNHLPETLMSLADTILARTDKLDPYGNEILEDLLRVLLTLRTSGVNQQLDHLRYLQESAQNEGDIRASEYQNAMTQFITLLGRLHRAQNRHTNHSFTN
jgi:DNA primase